MATLRVRALRAHKRAKRGAARTPRYRSFAASKEKIHENSLFGKKSRKVLPLLKEFNNVTAGGTVKSKCFVSYVRLKQNPSNPPSQISPPPVPPPLIPPFIIPPARLLVSKEYYCLIQ